MAELMNVLSKYGVAGLLLIVLVYILVRGRIVFHYPRPTNKSEKD